MTEEFDEEVQQFGDEESCFKCSDQPSVVLKQVQEWEYNETERDNQKVKNTFFICESHHNMLIQKGGEMF